MDAPHNLRKVKTARFNPKDPLSYRKALGESQGTFWQRFGVTQSGGSRYESGRTIPRSVRLLMALYASGTVSDEDLKIAAGAKPKRGRAGG
jgi:transcriptional regulator with XRE-family HTH domain